MRTPESPVTSPASSLAPPLSRTMENVKGSRSPNVLVTLLVNTPIKAADCPARQLSVSLLELTANLREVSIIREKAPTY